MRILICRTDSIGDVMLTLPMAYYIKQMMPNAHVMFLGKSYTQAIIERCLWVDDFLNSDNAYTLEDAVQLIETTKPDTMLFALPDKKWMKAAYKAKVPKRVATGHRLASWRWANVRPMFGRKNSDLHEAQLNLKLLDCLGFNENPTLEELNKLELLYFNSTRKVRRLIIHPFSQGSALNWTLSDYDELVGMLSDTDWEIVISGTQKDQSELTNFSGKNLLRIDSVCGLFTLSDFIDYVAESSVLLACSTGPLHLAATSGIHAVGLYVDRRPIHPERWAPLGKHVHVIKESDSKQEQVMISPSLVATFLKSIMEPLATKH